LILGAVFSSLATTFYDFRIAKLLIENKADMRSKLRNFDQYIENIMDLFRKIKKNSKNRIILILILTNHIIECVDTKCHCRNFLLYEIIDKNNKIYKKL